MTAPGCRAWSSSVSAWTELSCSYDRWTSWTYACQKGQSCANYGSPTRDITPSSPDPAYGTFLQLRAGHPAQSYLQSCCFRQYYFARSSPTARFGSPRCNPSRCPDSQTSDCALLLCCSLPRFCRNRVVYWHFATYLAWIWAAIKCYPTVVASDDSYWNHWRQITLPTSREGQCWHFWPLNLLCSNWSCYDLWNACSAGVEPGFHHCSPWGAYYAWVWCCELY